MKRWKITSVVIVLVFGATAAHADLAATEGLAIDLSSAGPGADFTIAFDPTEITGGTTWDDGGEASVLWRWNLSAGDPTITFGNGVVNISSGALQEGGVGILNNDEMDGSAELLAIVDDETGSGGGSPLLVFNFNPTLTGALLAGILSDNDDMVFEADADNNGSNKYSFTDGASAEIASLTEAGVWYLSGSLELGHASDTTIARSGAGAITVEGVAVVLAGSASHNGFSDYVANEHIDWTSDQGATNIHSGNIPDLSGTYEPAGISASDISDLAAGTDITADLEEEAHAAEHAVGGGDTVFPADPGADRYLMWDDDPGALVWQSIGGGGDMLKSTYDVSEDGFVDGNDTAYGAGWNGDVNAPSMNVVYDQMELRQPLNTVLTELTALTDPGADRVPFWNDTSNNFEFKTIGAAAGNLAAGDHAHTGTYEPAGITAADISDTHAGTDITADLEEEVTEGSLANSTIVSDDIKDGEVAVADLATAAKTHFLTIPVTSPTDAADVAVTRFPYAITVVAVHVLCVGGTSWTGHVDEFDSNGANAAGVDGATDIVASAGTSTNDDGTLSNASIDAGDYVGIHTTSVSGSVTRVLITLDYVIQ